MKIRFRLTRALSLLLLLLLQLVFLPLPPLSDTVTAVMDETASNWIMMDLDGP